MKKLIILPILIAFFFNSFAQETVNEILDGLPVDDCRPIPDVPSEPGLYGTFVNGFNCNVGQSDEPEKQFKITSGTNNGTTHSVTNRENLIITWNPHPIRTEYTYYVVLGIGITGDVLFCENVGKNLEYSLAFCDFKTPIQQLTVRVEAWTDVEFDADAKELGRGNYFKCSDETLVLFIENSIGAIPEIQARFEVVCGEGPHTLESNIQLGENMEVVWYDQVTDFDDDIYKTGSTIEETIPRQGTTFYQFALREYYPICNDYKYGPRKLFTVLRQDPIPIVNSNLINYQTVCKGGDQKITAPDYPLNDPEINIAWYEMDELTNENNFFTVGQTIDYNINSNITQLGFRYYRNDPICGIQFSQPGVINILWVGKKGTFYPDAKIDVFYGEEGYFNLVATNSFATISSEQLKYRWYDANYNLINEGNPFNAFLKEGCNIFYVSLYSESCDVESKKVEYFAYLFNPKNPIIEEFCTENAGFNCKVEKYVMDCVAEPKGCITYTVECSPKLKEETDPLLKKSEHPENSNIEKGFSQNSKSLSFIVVDLLGKKVYEGPVNKFSTNKLHSGIYITYESFNNKTKIVNKIIIQK